MNAPTEIPTGEGFIKWVRSPEAEQLLDDPYAFTLLAIIARRANRHATPNRAGLGYGQAFIGDCEKRRMSEKEYRCAKQRLEKLGLATFEGIRGWGTVATISNERVFSFRDARKQPKKGDFKGDLFSGEKTPDGAISGANSGRKQGELTANNGEQRTEKGEDKTLAADAAESASNSSMERERNPHIDALAQAEGIPLDEIGAAGARLGAALKVIRKSKKDVTPEEILRRAKNYPLHFPNVEASLTANALAKHWGKCHAAPNGAARTDYETDMARMGFSKEEML